MIVLNSYFLTSQDSQKTVEDGKVSQNKRIKRYILQRKGLIRRSRVNPPFCLESKLDFKVWLKRCFLLSLQEKIVLFHFGLVLTIVIRTRNSSETNIMPLF